MAKNSFILYQSYYEILKDLSDLEKGQLLNAIFIYEIENKVTDLSPVLKMAFAFIRKDLDNNKEKYQKTVEKNSLNGVKGGRPKSKETIDKQRKNETKNPKNPPLSKETQKSQRFLEKPKKADDVDVDVNEDEDDKEKDKDCLTKVKPLQKSCGFVGQEDKPDKAAQKEENFNLFAENTANLWNAFCVKNPIFAKVLDLTPERRKRLKLRFLRQRFRN